MPFTETQYRRNGRDTVACEGIRTVTIEFCLRMCCAYIGFNYTSTKLGDITNEFIISKLNRVLRKFKKCLTTFLARCIFMCVYGVFIKRLQTRFPKSWNITKYFPNKNYFFHIIITRVLTKRSLSLFTYRTISTRLLRPGWSTPEVRTSGKGGRIVPEANVLKIKRNVIRREWYLSCKSSYRVVGLKPHGH